MVTSFTKRKKIHLDDIMEDDVLNDTSNIYQSNSNSNNSNDDTNNDAKMTHDSNHENDDDDKEKDHQSSSQMKYIIEEIDTEETQQYSMDDTTQHYSVMEVYEENSIDDNNENNHDNNDNNDSSKFETIIQLDDNDESFTNSPPAHTSKNITTRSIQNHNDNAVLGTSPKLSPIAIMGSQSSTTTSTHAMSTTTTANSGTIDATNNLSSDMMDDEQIESNVNVKTNGNGNENETVLSFMTLFQSLLHKIDNANDDNDNNDEESILNCNNRLLEKYCIYLIGENNSDHTDPCQRQDETNEKNKSNTQIDWKSFTKGRICLLLKLCGAEVKTLTSDSSLRSKQSSSSTTNTNQMTLFLVQGFSLSSECQDQIQDFVKKKKKHGTSSRSRKKVQDVVYPVVSIQWLLDSIVSFQVKDIDDTYTLM